MNVEGKAGTQEMTKIRWGVAVSTRNRPDELVELVASIARQTTRPTAVAIVDQSTVPLIEARALIDGYAARAGFSVLWRLGGRGLSAGRNVAFRILAGHADWAVTPNDTSTLDEEFGDVLSRTVAAFPRSSSVIGTYAVNGTPHRNPGETGRRLAGRELWIPIEPSCVWHVDQLLAVGGFDERIGTGSAGSAQSGEGTDLLLRMARHAPVVAAPDLVVHGRPHAFGLQPAARVAKDYSYAVGTGIVFRRHFPGLATYPRLVWPAAQGVLHALRKRDAGEMRGGFARARGRIYGYLFPKWALRPRGDANLSDRWRSASPGR
jgi:hypothetical protein